MPWAGMCRETAGVPDIYPPVRVHAATLASSIEPACQQARAPARWNRSPRRAVQARVMAAMRWRGLRARWLLPAIGLVLVSASCGVRPAATRPVQPSGSTALIFGVVQAIPGCPVGRQHGMCGPRRLGDIRVEARSLPAGVIASTRTRADGHYSLRLVRGRYVLVAVMRQVPPRCPRVFVSLTPPAPVRANINCDSGIR